MLSSDKQPVIYLVPSLLAEGVTACLPDYLLDAVKDCEVIIAENERTTRRFLKLLDAEIKIDDFEWHTMHKSEADLVPMLKKAIAAKRNIAIISEAGCPSVADPGQLLVAAAQELNCVVKPLVGPSSIVLALMASGMNGQGFLFAGYLPIDKTERAKKIRQLEGLSAKENLTIICIETPYRNDQLLESLTQQCMPNTKLCVAVNLTAQNEWIKTKLIKHWAKEKPSFHKVPAIFLWQAG
jgi:16S rRNA (cytidine1402-2'-O)-methyltransferase